MIISNTFVGFMLTTGSWVAVLVTDGCTCRVFEVTIEGRIVVCTNLVWWGRGEGNDSDGVFLDVWIEDTDGEEDDGSNTTGVNPEPVKDVDDEAKTGGWETLRLDVNEGKLSETPAKMQ